MYTFSSVQSLDRLGRRRDTKDASAEILFRSFLQEALVSSSGMGRNVHSLMLSTSAFPLPTTVSPTLQSALKYGFEEAVFVCDMPNRCKSPSHDSCQNRFLWTYRGTDLATHQVIVLVIQVRDAEKFPQALGFEGLDPFLSSHTDGWR